MHPLEFLGNLGGAFHSYAEVERENIFLDALILIISPLLSRLPEEKLIYPSAGWPSYGLRMRRILVYPLMLHNILRKHKYYFIKRIRGFDMHLIAKIVINGLFAVVLLLWLTNATFWEAALASVLLSVIAYYVGDQLVLRSANNTVATIVDAVMVFAYFWVVSYFFNWNLSMGGLLIITVVFGVIEVFFHRYIAGGSRKAATT